MQLLFSSVHQINNCISVIANSHWNWKAINELSCDVLSFVVMAILKKLAEENRYEQKQVQIILFSLFTYFTWSQYGRNFCSTVFLLWIIRK